MMSAIYWFFKTCEPGDTWSEMYPQQALQYAHLQGVFVVPRGNLESSVAVFSIVGTICILGLAVRRKTVGAELGGPPKIAWASAAFFVCLWFVYVSISVLDALAKREGLDTRALF